MIEIDIPGFGMVRLEHLVSDFTGTLSVDGILLPKVAARLNKLSKVMKIYILTADTFGKAKAELKNVKCEIHILTGKNHDLQKEAFVKKIGPEGVAAFGNGKNDRKMLKTAKIGIAVTEGEGCAVDAIIAADIRRCRANGSATIRGKAKGIRRTAINTLPGLFPRQRRCPADMTTTHGRTSIAKPSKRIGW